nr:putative reverse transcriptase domain-containing protein [Tanacetum cinerariifolium]
MINFLKRPFSGRSLVLCACVLMTSRPSYLFRCDTFRGYDILVSKPGTRQGLSSAAIMQLINQRIADAIATYEANRSNENATQNEGVVGLTRWFEKLEAVFRISKCAIGSQVKFATCTLLDGALTWWNSHVQTELSLLCPRMVLEEEDKIQSTYVVSQITL